LLREIKLAIAVDGPEIPNITPEERLGKRIELMAESIAAL
jgi:hypothetical protein